MLKLDSSVTLEFLRASRFFLVTIILALLGTPAASADDFTLGIKGWDASLSANNLDGDSDVFTGLYFSWVGNKRLWVSAAYVEGEAGFTLSGAGTQGTIEEVDSDFVIGWDFAKIDVGFGYRFAEFTTNILDLATPVVSTGPMAYLGGGDLFGQTNWGYYWGVAYMFADLDDDDGEQEHVNGEGGFRWTSRTNVSVLFGYRYKDYSGDGGGFSFSGPVVNLAYTWR